jgi:transposase
MRDTALYQRIFGLEKPWFVKRMDLQIAENRVDIWLEHRGGAKWPCPKCGQELPCRDHAEERAWRHLDTCQFQTHLYARIPRLECPEHGVLQVAVPWAEARSRVTMLMEGFVIDVLQQCATVMSTCRLLRLSWDEVWSVMQRAVRRGLARKRQRPLSVIGVDEKAFKKGHKYMTVVCDLENVMLEHMAEDRRSESLEALWQSLSTDQLTGIKAIAMDMWTPYIQATLKYVPDAGGKIVFDRFHIMHHMVNAVDKVRRQEHRPLSAAGDDPLKGTKYLWLYSEENLPDKHRPPWRPSKS